jgi:tetratricopeptide (TPR) repeat protein
MRVMKHVKIILCLLASSTALAACDEGTQTSNYSGKSSTGNYLAAKFAFKNNDFDSAIRYTHKALSKDPQNTSLIKKLYGLKIIQGEYEDAINLAKKHRRINDDGYFSDLLLALSSFKEGNFDEAVTHLNKLNEAPKDVTGPEISGILLPSMTVWAQVGKKDYKRALKTIDAQTPEKGLEDFHVYQRALINELAGDVKGAKASFDDLVTRPYAYGVVKRAVDFYHRNNFAAEAKIAIDNYYRFSPVKSGQTPFINNFKEDATPKLDAEEVTNQIISGLLNEVATLQKGSNRLDDAILYYRLALMLDTSNEQTSILLARTLEDKTLYSQAVEIYKSIPDSSRYRLSIEQDIALVYNKMGKLNQAKALLITVSQKDPTRVDALLNLGDILVSNKDYSEASEYYATAVQRIGSSKDGLKPSHWPILYALAICYEQSDRWDSAEKTFIQALALSPDEPDVLNYLAYSWLDKGINFERAEKMLKTAVTQRPGDAHILDSYGWSLYKLERYKEALFFLEQANRRIPYDPTTNDHLGDIYWKIGRTNEASFMWKRALIFDPKPKEIVIIKQKIAHGLDYKKPKLQNGPKMVKSDHIRQE